MNREAPPPLPLPEETEDFRAFQARVRGTNISEDTLLATDYLNHFNEIVMTIEMIPDMPELLDDAKAWRPKTYPEHFRDSTFSDRELAVEAYEHVPRRYREPFETTIRQMDHVIAFGIKQLEADIADGNPELIRVTATSVSRLVQRLIDVASAIIHGSDRAMAQDEIDAVMKR
jgi:hypothetical protein